jgi:hypothetical protein
VKRKRSLLRRLAPFGEVKLAIGESLSWNHYYGKEKCVLKGQRKFDEVELLRAAGRTAAQISQS